MINWFANRCYASETFWLWNQHPEISGRLIQTKTANYINAMQVFQGRFANKLTCQQITGILELFQSCRCSDIQTSDQIEEYYIQYIASIAFLRRKFWMCFKKCTEMIYYLRRFKNKQNKNTTEIKIKILQNKNNTFIRP